ncbi:MAG: DUF4175 family protein, partial [Pseudomonadota bacterium]
MTSGAPGGRAEPESEALSDREASLSRRLAWRTGLSRLALLLERLIAALWPTAAVALAFFAASIGGLWLRVGETGAAILSLAFVLLLAGALWYAARTFRWPSMAEARARLDRGRPGRPVASFDETLALGAGDAGSQTLWRAHRTQVLARAGDARAEAPDTRVGGDRDPYALRFFAALGLLAALLLGATSGRVSDAFAPQRSAASALAEIRPSVEMWATPPAYTGVAPIYFDTAEARLGARGLPVGTEVTLRVFDAPSRPDLTLTPAPDENPLTREGAPADAETTAETEAADASEPAVYVASLILEQDLQITLDAGDERFVDLALSVIPDAAPTIGFEEDPKRGSFGALEFSFSADDDYGVSRAWATIALDPEADRDPAAEPQDAFELELPIPLSARDLPPEVEPTAEELTETISEDLTEHPWVGLPVVLTLHAEDDAGQRAASAPKRLVMPGRRFSEPMAKALIEQRANLAWSRYGAPRIYRILNAVTRNPDAYFEDMATPLLLIRSAISRLDYALREDQQGDPEVEDAFATVAEARPEIMEKLYRAAELLEDGGLDNAAKRLARAQRRLREAIENGASQEEISELMRELREAMRDYMRALAELGRRDPNMAQQGGQQGQRLDMSELQRLLEELEKATREGRVEDAERLMA